MKRHELTETVCRNAQPGAKAYQLSDGYGLFLLVMPNGSKYWRYKYSTPARRATMTLGVYPWVSLKDARLKHFECRRQLQLGHDPGVQKQEAKDQASVTFGVVAEQFLTKMQGEWAESSYGARASRVRRYLITTLGQVPIATITTQTVWQVLKDLQDKRGPVDTVHRVGDLISQVFQFAVQTGAGGIKVNPCSELRRALTPVPVNHHAMLKHPHQVGQLLLALEDMTDITETVRAAFLVMVYCWPRTESMRLATWDQMDFGDETTGEPAIWTIPGTNMKRTQAAKAGEDMPDHLIPLPTQAVALLRSLKASARSEKDYVFPSQLGRSRMMSDGTLRSVLRRLGYDKSQMQIHAWRAVAGTMLREQPALKFPLVSNASHKELIEVQLAHDFKGKAEKPYNRAEYLADRITMMQTWADFIDTVKAEAHQPQARRPRKAAQLQEAR